MQLDAIDLILKVYFCYSLACTLNWAKAGREGGKGKGEIKCRYSQIVAEAHHFTRPLLGKLTIDGTLQWEL